MYITTYIRQAMHVGHGMIEFTVHKDKIVKTVPPTSFVGDSWPDIIRREDIRDEVILYAS